MSRNDNGQPDIDVNSNSENSADNTDDFSVFDLSGFSKKEKATRSDEILAELENMRISDFVKSHPKAVNDENLHEALEEHCDKHSIEPVQSNEIEEYSLEEEDISDMHNDSSAEEESLDIPEEHTDEEEVSNVSEDLSDIEEIQNIPDEYSDKENAANASEEFSDTEEILNVPEVQSDEENVSNVSEDLSDTEEILNGPEVPVNDVSDDAEVQKNSENSHVSESIDRIGKTHEEYSEDLSNDTDDVEIRVVSWNRNKRKSESAKISTYTKTRAESYSREQRNHIDIDTHTAGQADIQESAALPDAGKDDDLEIKFCDFRNIAPRKPSASAAPKASPQNPVRDKSHPVLSETTKKKLIKIVKETSITIGIFFLIFVIMVTFNIYVHRKNEVFGSSMEPTLHEGDVVYTTMLPYIFGNPEIGDIVIVDRDLKDTQGYFHMFSQVVKRNSIAAFIMGSENIELDTCWIKRVVGLPGDILEFNNGQFYRNSELIEEDYIKDSDVITYPNGTTIVVPDGHIYVMGDNRNASKDSRDITVGPIPFHQVIGKMWKTG